MSLAFVVSLNAASTGTTRLHTPQGASAGTDFGDFVSDNDTTPAVALDTFYRYYIEVPRNQARLVVDFFDADIGLGGATEDTAGRDRERGAYNTAARYTLFDPAGVQRTTVFDTGNTTLPAGGDNAWLNFFDGTGDTVRDTFSANAYSNNNGTINWDANWFETNDDNNVGGGNIRVNGGVLFLEDANNMIVTRQADLSTFSSATLTFTYDTDNFEANNSWRVEVSNNGGGSWTTLQTYTGTAGGNASFDISSFIAANTRIRFVTVANFDNNDRLNIDNVQIADSFIPSGHWEVRIDMSDAITTGDDINAFGIRAHDGTSGAGGTEYNMYADSFISLGVNPPGSGTTSRAYVLHPYFTSGCTCSHNDFDVDANNGNTGSMVYTSPTGTFTQTLNSGVLSGTDVWARANITGYRNDQLAGNYGVWQLGATINSYLTPGVNGNYATIYNTNYAAAANPPTSNPAANAFRIYLPTDAGGVPLKPYLEQEVRSKGGSIPTVGGSWDYTVTVRLVNPTPWAINFSSPTNIVTANVPGAGATYRGNAQVGQGSILSQPAVGGTGNITWNPGQVAAGATVILAYDVRVTPTVAGQRIPVTATPASGNGTRARFVDETGNTTQARATYLAGPVCEIAVTEGLVTPVLLSSFDVAVRGNKTVLEWKTASEIGTVGFNVHRLERGQLVKANRQMLPANVGAPQGGRYRFVDSDNSDAGAMYVLEELTANGKKQHYGPFGMRGDAQGPSDGSEFSREPRKDRKPSVKQPKGKKAKPVAVMAGVATTGIVRITAAQLAEQLNVSADAVQKEIRKGGVQVTSRGKEVAWTPAQGNDAILFFGEGSDNHYSTERVYRIELAKGTQMSVVNATAGAPGTTIYSATKNVETDAFPATVLPLDAESDYWFWDFILSGDATFGRKAFALNASALASSDSATLTVRLQGALANASHRATVMLNGGYLGEAEWSSLDATTATFAVPSQLLRDGANEVAVEGVLANGESFDILYVDGFELRYQRNAQPENGRLEMTVQKGSNVAAGPFNGAPVVLDINNRLRPTLVQASGAFAAPSKSLFLSDATGFVAPTSMRAAEELTLKKKQRADYLVITAPELRTGAEALAKLRERDGLSTFVADLDQIYDEFSGGNPTPHAIREFIASTAQWDKAPKYVVLAGNGTYDYRGIETDPGLFPPMLTKTADGIFAADSLFADRTGDALPDVALGRIAVSSNTELAAYVAKLEKAERTNSGKSPIVFSADGVDRAADFRAASQQAETPLAGRPATQVYIDDLGGEAARASLMAAWQSGTPLVSWVGHGGLDRLSSGSLLTVEDAPALTSAGPLPMLIAMTCTINRFEVGFAESLGAALTRTPNAGALAVWSSSGLSVHSNAAELQKTFMRLAAQNPKSRIGDLVVQTLASTPNLGDTGSVYLLLGDPAARLSLPNESTRPVVASRSGE
ncbi:MAG TPA: C25 family cysteine peptidase [Thermoanaerobaculia bacterium]